MTKFNNLDDNLLKIEKYRNAILKELGNSERLNLSEAFTKLIGYTERNKNQFIEEDLSGFFYVETHDTDGLDELRESAVKKLNSLLNVANTKLGDLDSYSTTVNREEREKFRNKYLSIGPANIKAIFSEKFTCKGSRKKNIECDIEFTVNMNINNMKKDDTSCLYLPPACITKKLDIIVENIVRHSICQHVKGSTTFTIDLIGTNVGTKSECLYIMALIINPMQPWDKDEEGELVKPTIGEYEIDNNKKMLPYCDYMILVPVNSNYSLINLAAKYNDTADGWKKLPSDGVLEEMVRFKLGKLAIKKVSGEIIFHADPNASKGWKSITIREGTIVHLCVFNNHQKS